MAEVEESSPSRPLLVHDLYKIIIKFVLNSAGDQGSSFNTLEDFGTLSTLLPKNKQNIPPKHATLINLTPLCSTGSSERGSRGLSDAPRRVRDQLWPLRLEYWGGAHRLHHFAALCKNPEGPYCGRQPLARSGASPAQGAESRGFCESPEFRNRQSCPSLRAQDPL